MSQDTSIKDGHNPYHNLSSLITHSYQRTDDDISKSQREGDAGEHSPILQGSNSVNMSAQGLDGKPDREKQMHGNTEQSQGVNLSVMSLPAFQQDTTLSRKVSASLLPPTKCVDKDSVIEQDDTVQTDDKVKQTNSIEQENAIHRAQLPSLDQDNLLSWVEHSDAESRSPSPEPQCHSKAMSRRWVWSALDEDEDESSSDGESLPETKDTQLSNHSDNQVLDASNSKDKGKTPEDSCGSEETNPPKKTSGLSETKIEQKPVTKPQPWWAFLPQWEDYLSKGREWAKCCVHCSVIFAHETRLCDHCKSPNCPLTPQLYIHYMYLMRKELLEWILDYRNAPKVDWADKWQIPTDYADKCHLRARRHGGWFWLSLMDDIQPQIADHEDH